MNTIIDTYGFDGIDLDLEGASVSTTGGTITSPADSSIKNLVEAVKEIMHDYYNTHTKHLLLTMAPETAFVQGGMSAYGSIWGAYLPVIHALRDSIDLLQVQLYNSGSMYGIDGNIYNQGTADFIVAMTEAVIQGFNTAGGNFTGLPPEKIAVGLPACANAAGSGFIDTAVVRSAIDYIRGTGPRPGNYTLQQPGGYPAMQSMMTWSINWDAVSNCSSVYSYAENFETIFNLSTGIFLSDVSSTVSFYPDPVTEFLNIKCRKETLIRIYNSIGDCVYTGRNMNDEIKIDVRNFLNGIYFAVTDAGCGKFVKCNR
jgi:chitinase